MVLNPDFTFEPEVLNIVGHPGDQRFPPVIFIRIINADDFRDCTVWVFTYFFILREVIQAVLQPPFAQVFLGLFQDALDAGDTFIALTLFLRR